MAQKFVRNRPEIYHKVRNNPAYPMLYQELCSNHRLQAKIDGSPLTPIPTEAEWLSAIADEFARHPAEHKRDPKFANIPRDIFKKMVVEKSPASHPEVLGHEIQPVKQNKFSELNDPHDGDDRWRSYLARKAESNEPSR